MESAHDWRRHKEAAVSVTVTRDHDKGEIGGDTGLEMEDDSSPGAKPRHFYLLDGRHGLWEQQVREATSWTSPEPVPWSPSSAVVYGRNIHTPKHYNGIVHWKFEDLVETFGPADYITMASTYHTFIIDEVPILTILQKNEARRFITLLDALYEARCKLLIRAESPPDDLFFPERRGPPGKDGSSKHVDPTYSETISTVYQDQVSPFRPNVSYYDTQSTTSKYDPDQDSDFGVQKKPVDFGNTSAFTGEDERFAYKRAISRLWELCSAQWHARTGDWWQPLPVEARHWEGGQPSQPHRHVLGSSQRTSGEGVGDRVEVDEPAGLSKWRVQELVKQYQGKQ